MSGPDAKDNELLDRAHTTLRNLKHLRIARYRIEDVKNATYVRGGFSEVKQKKLRGRRLLIGYKMVAVKSLGLEGSRSERIQSLVAFARELHVWSQTHHPNVLPLKGFIYNEADPDIKEAWIITRWQWRGDITQYLTPEIGPERRLELAIDTALALAWLHSQNIYHGDIKAENTLISDSGKAMLCDFGLAKIVATTTGLTAPGPPKSTPRYASPELFKGEMTDDPLPRDVWAWGCLLPKVMTDIRPHDSCNNREALSTAINAHQLPANIETIDWSRRKALEFSKAILAKCWGISPDSRPSMAQCKAQLSNGFFEVATIPRSARIMAQYKTVGSGWDMIHIPSSGEPFGLEFSTISNKLPPGKYRFSPNGEYIAVMSRKVLLLYGTAPENAGDPRVLLGVGVDQEDPDAKEELDPLDITEICFADNGSLLAVGFEGGLVQLWDFPSMSNHVDLTGHTQRVSALLFSNSQLVSASLDNTIRTWDAKDHSTSHIETTPSLPRILVSSPQHRFIIVAYNTLLELRDITIGNCVATIPTAAETVAFAPGGNEFITGATAPGLQRWDIQPWLGSRPDDEIGAEFELTSRPLYGPQSEITSLSISSDGKLAASSSWGRDDVALWDLKDGHMVALLRGEKIIGTPHVTFSPSSSGAAGSLAIATSGVLRLVKYRAVRTDVPKRSPRWPFLHKPSSSET